MIKNLVIVESPAKAKTIESFLGKDFTVKSSYGHIRDLEKKNNGVEVENNFKPIYHIPKEKKKVVSELKKLAADAKIVWLASDEDREGEAISWHLKEALKLPDNKIKRIVFHEITKSAITNAVSNPRGIDFDLVNAQQARRILDRLVGFKLSPVLWRKVKPSLSAGRVQSVAVRLIVEREREIETFVSESKFRVTAEFLYVDENGIDRKFRAELPHKFNSEKEAEEFLHDCLNAEFTVDSLEKKPFTKSPAAPFTTSTLQQEASRKLRYSVRRTMRIAQSLYEAGKITYMRTDSVNLSELAITAAQEHINSQFGANYSSPHRYKTKSASAQEAHEAIRPTNFDSEMVSGSSDEQALYSLIWKRAIASQMSRAELERTTLKISISGRSEKFVAKGEVIKFDGFLKVYLESTDDENTDQNGNDIIPPLKEGDKLSASKILATQRFSRPPARYTEASLVKKLEELGIGRPSTYAPTIDTIQNRGYVIREEREGVERKYIVLALDNDKGVSKQIKTEITGNEKGKLYPSDIAMLVSDFLLENFPNIMDYKFTAKIEKELDDIAKGLLDWHKMLEAFYFPFNEKIEHTIEHSERVSGERILGTDPKTGKQISVRMARFGPVAQLTDLDDADAKPQYAGLRNGQKLASLTLEEALDLFKLPRNLGQFEDEDVIVAIGRFGPYIRHKGKFTSLGKDFDPYTVELDKAIELIENKRKADLEKLLKTFEEDADCQILKGRWGPYLKYGKKNVRLPKDVDIEKMTFADCKELADNAPAKGKRSTKKK